MVSRAIRHVLPPPATWQVFLITDPTLHAEIVPHAEDVAAAEVGPDHEVNGSDSVLEPAPGLGEHDGVLLEVGADPPV